MEHLYFENITGWQEWLKDHFDKESGVWLAFYRKETGKPSIDYEAAVETALCYGWIDSIIKKLDRESYVRKFTPRKDKSKWSELNKKRVSRLISENRMTEAGLAKIEIARKNGQWYKPDKPDIDFELPQEFLDALNRNDKALNNFKQMAKSYQKQFAGWILMAKRTETKNERIKESVELLEKNKKLGLK